MLSDPNSNGLIKYVGEVENNKTTKKKPQKGASQVPIPPGEIG